MKTIKTETILTDFMGKPLKHAGHDLTIGIAVSVSLAGKTTDPTLAWILGNKFSKDKEVKLTPEDIVFIKEIMKTTEAWFSIVTGQVIQLLEGKEEK